MGVGMGVCFGSQLNHEKGLGDRGPLHMIHFLFEDQNVCHMSGVYISDSDLKACRMKIELHAGTMFLI